MKIAEKLTGKPARKGGTEPAPKKHDRHVRLEEVPGMGADFDHIVGTRVADGKTHRHRFYLTIPHSRRKAIDRVCQRLKVPVPDDWQPGGAWG